MVGGGRATVLTLLADRSDLVAGARIRLAEEQGRHARVRRLEVGEPVALTDGRGTMACGVLREGGVVDVAEVRSEPAPPALTLAVGAGDRERFGWLAEKATELGVTTLLPLETARSASVAGRVRAGHVRKLAARAREAVKQCGAAWATEVADPTSVTAFTAAAAGIRWLADPSGPPPPSLSPDEPVTVAVGPEGGFTEVEAAAMIGAGFRPVRLGSRTLRFETAALAAAIVIGQERQRKPGEARP